MNASKVAHKLALLGINAINTQEPSYDEDGMVEITAAVHVQVPYEGKELGVVEEDAEGLFEFYDLTTSFTEIATQIKACLSKSVS
jgi:hypothetical protein